MTPSSPPPSSTGGLSTEAVAGIGVGAGGVGLAILGGLGYFLFRRRKASPKSEDVFTTPSNTTSHPPHGTITESDNANADTPYRGLYNPVKIRDIPTSQNITQAFPHNFNPPEPAVHDQQYSQPYPQQYGDAYTLFPHQQYGAELPSTPKSPSELPVPMVGDAQTSTSAQPNYQASPTTHR